MNTGQTDIDEILVVDDAPASLKLLADILNGAGYRVRLRHRWRGGPSQRKDSTASIGTTGHQDA